MQYLHLIDLVDTGVVVKENLHDNSVPCCRSQHQCRTVLVISDINNHRHRKDVKVWLLDIALLTREES